MRRMAGLLVSALLAAVAASPPALAQTFNSGSTGADGPFSPTAATTLTLPPSGIFNFTTINIPTGVIVRFTRNATNTPVTLLASGNITIAGTIDVAGAPGGAASGTNTTVGSNGGLGGPGGFDGGSGATGFISTTGGSGLGPGGGSGSSAIATNSGSGAGGAGALTSGVNGTAAAGSTAGTGGAAYGTASLLPLVGGSGGGGGGAVPGKTGGGGGGGGGALVIASSGTITMASTGAILAQGGAGAGSTGAVGFGGAGGGSGGSVRLVATSITGSGTINIAGGTAIGAVPGGSGSAGRLRVEAFSNTLSVNVGAQPPGAVTSGSPTSVTLANGPTLRIASIGGVAAPASPRGSFTVADVVLPPGTTNPVTVNLEASNVPLGTTVTVSVKGQYGAGSSGASSALAGTVAASTASASVTVPTNEPSIVSASASFTLTASSGRGPVFAEGEEVEGVRVTATLGGDSRVAYITRSGREVLLRTR